MQCWLLAVGAIGLCAGAVPAYAQTELDRVDPSAVVDERKRDAIDPGDSPTTALPPTSEPLATPGAVAVGAISLVGLEVLHPADFADIVAAHFGRTLNADELAALTGLITERARARGYLFATAWIEPQTLAAGVLRIRVDEGRIDQVRIEGSDNPAIGQALRPLVTGKPITLDALERRLLIAGDLHGIRLSRSRFLREGPHGILIVALLSDRTAARLTIENDGSRPIGPVQARLAVDFNALLFADDTVGVTLLTTPLEPGEFKYGRVRYAKRISPAGTELSLSGSYAFSHPGSYLRSRDIRGESWLLSAGLLHPLHRRRATSLWLDAGLELRDLAQSRRGVLARRDRLAIARLGFYGYDTMLGGVLRVNVSINQGLDILGATEAGDPLASRDDADGSFTAFIAWADWTTGLFERASLRLAVQSQLASEALLVSEEIGLGGGRFLRGYDYNERSGDQSAMASGELRYDLGKRFGPARDTQFYAFVDGGHVSNLEDGGRDGSLFSTGGGLRADVTSSLDANLEVAVPLSGERYDSGDANPQINVKVVKRF